MRTAKTVFNFVFIFLFLPAAMTHAQSPKTVWDTHEEIREWISFPQGTPNRGVEDLTEDGRTFVRIKWGELDEGTIIANPGFGTFSMFSPQGLTTLIDPGSHNAVNVVIRHTMGLNELAGRWGHRNGQYDESLRTIPGFDPQELPGDGQWHEVTLKLTDSAFFDPGDDVVYMFLSIVDSSLTAAENGARLSSVLSTAFMDIDRIELVQISESIPIPQITDFNPKRGWGGDEVTIEGTGFAEPATRNVVYFGYATAHIISGDSISLTVEAPSTVDSHPIVQTPGGGRAVASGIYVYLKSPYDIIIVSGNGQIGPVGSQLSPLEVKVIGTDSEGLPGLVVKFSFVSGSGILSSNEGTTNDDGIASTLLTLDDIPGEVKVEATWYNFRPVIFTATATP